VSDALYNTQILRLAAEGGASARLAAPQGSASKVSPICGSKVTVDVVLDAAGHISHWGQEVKACALGQAAARLVELAAIGHDAASLGAARAQLADWLVGRRDAPPEWPGFDIFAPARPHRARHPSILLAFDAGLAAVAAAVAAAAPIAADLPA
jgi:NifU-like protein involved in Fe-S cluster formation